MAFPSLQSLKQAYRHSPSAEINRTYCDDAGLRYHYRNYRLYIPPAFREAVMYWAHAGKGAAHRGVNVTTKAIKRLFWWNKVHTDVTRYVSSCLPCMRFRAGKRPSLSYVLESPTPFEMISIDSVGPRQLTTKTIIHYYVVIDHCTRYVVTRPVNVITTSAAIETLAVHWVPTFGAPRVCLTDNHTTF